LVDQASVDQLDQQASQKSNRDCKLQLQVKRKSNVKLSPLFSEQSHQSATVVLSELVLSELYLLFDFIVAAARLNQENYPN
jgi:hypothetical protein